MISITYKPDKNFPQSLTRHLDVLMKVASDEAADLLSMKVSAGPRTGNHYKKYPRQSSAPGEYPQEQFSNLRSSVNVVKNSRMFYSVGFFGENIYKLMDLEYGMGTTSVSDHQPMNNGYNKGQRKPLFMLFIGKDGKRTRKAMNNSIQVAI